MSLRPHHLLSLFAGLIAVGLVAVLLVLIWGKTLFASSSTSPSKTISPPYTKTQTTTPVTSSTVPSSTKTDDTFHSGMHLKENTLDLAKAEADSRYDQVESRGGSLLSLDDGNTYGVWWQPEGFDAAHDVVLVSLGGHAGWATKDFDVWYPEITTRGYGFFTLQWWLGHSLQDSGYYTPDQMYAMIRQVLKEKGIPPGNVIFQAYSMGSARSYAITAMDHAGDDYFGLTIANSGVWEDDYPPNMAIADGTYGDLPLSGTRWILYCAVNDEEHPAWNKCESMDETQTKIEKYGGKVYLYIKDQTGSHGSFMVNRDNVHQALDVADTLVTGS